MNLFIRVCSKGIIHTCLFYWHEYKQKNKVLCNLTYDDDWRSKVCNCQK